MIEDFNSFNSLEDLTEDILDDDLPEEEIEDEDSYGEVEDDGDEDPDSLADDYDTYEDRDEF
jgi:hypothetical protein